MDSRDISQFSCKAEAFEASEDIGRNPSEGPTLGDIIAKRFGRRDMLRGSLAVAAITATFGPLALATAEKAKAAAGNGSKASFSFDEVSRGVDRTHHVAKGYKADILIRWGDPVLPGAPAFDPMKQTAAAQKMQFGYNNDYVGYIGLPYGSNNPDHGLLCINHEYTDEEVMFPGVGVEQQEAKFTAMTKDLAEIEMAAHGGTIIEVKKTDGKWAVVADSKYNRRITASDTVMRITGPAAGHDRMKTKADPTGTSVIGMINNCAGGITPWGTYVSAEENFNGNFGGKLADDHPEAENYKRLGVPGNWYNWGDYHDRFDVSKEPNEANRFGWMVEIDPLDPTSVPKKRTALGRFKHEGAESVVNKDSRVVFYMGDDERFDYVYKFVTEGKFNPNDRAANMDLLDKGTLYVAKYGEDGKGEWLPLVHGQGKLTAENGFKSQADVVIQARKAGDVLGATKMDRPEDVEPNKVTGKVYVMLTNNTRRKAEQVDVANPRADNAFGHIIEMTPTDGDHASTTFAWDILVKCGDPSVAAVGATFNPATSPDGWFGMPDNCAMDSQGRLWVTTDGNSYKATKTTDGVWAMETEGDLRGTSKLFFRVPIGAEMCGPVFTPDDKTLFLAVQHPATDNTKDWPEFGKASSFEDPATRWPDFKDGMPPRPSVVVVTKEDGGVIGV
ncbi:PhoX family phosphatase [Skermanella mucosa]|uniref:PhoX family protein n=1 Tax=Skermanella mucosa TaxID=1789672 RepID=UPI00192ADDDC|nr:PhoX family phosphatase [Skermanella mucosa]UEM22999.1 PhoX family phosphatase [Skermanella mucosa]